MIIRLIRDCFTGFVFCRRQTQALSDLPYNSPAISPCHSSPSVPNVSLFKLFGTISSSKGLTLQDARAH